VADYSAAPNETETLSCVLLICQPIPPMAGRATKLHLCFKTRHLL
jgi:hypothetical protein